MFSKWWKGCLVSIRFLFVLALTIVSGTSGSWWLALALMQSVSWYETGVWHSVNVGRLFMPSASPEPVLISSVLPDQPVGPAALTNWLLEPTAALGPHELIFSLLHWLSLPMTLFFCSAVIGLASERLADTLDANLTGTAL